MKIKLYKESDSRIWDNYIIRHPKASFFHLSDWKKVIETSFGHKAYYLIASDAKDDNLSSFRKIKGVFPLFSVESILFGKSMVSLPFAVYGGILADNESVKQSLFEYAVRITNNNHSDYLEIRTESENLSDLPEKELYFVFKKEIFYDNDKNLKAIPRKSRAMVRKALKNKLSHRFGSAELLDQFYEMFAFNYRRLGTPVFSKKYLKNLLDIFNDKSSILIIYKDKMPLSGVLSFYFRDQVIPYYSGAYPAANRLAANDYLYWTLMSNAADNGYRVFDFGRSKKDTGPYRFKKHWGFKPSLLHYQYYLNNLDELPNISPANPKYRRRIELWKKLPLWATKIIGPEIVKYVP